MAKITVGGISYEGTIEEIKELMEMQSVEFPIEQAEAGESKRWANIGRNPDEYKKGDIVRYISDGEVCEVVGISEKGHPKVKTQDSGICTEYYAIELVTPVEARFDRA
ncbi:hypothetical protein [Peribacillus butanolivorans]|uniref:Uncharacterized protein n=1 Tax=Peribacillus butanolivorans TaxID=421767 RepID=A0ABM6XMU1_9BACI|nr:hypothetical protein [Peribacillus butanolivorans]AXN39821.1 hypothetical protein DTO10_16595 [Peribacillus butanolivorans]